MLLPVAEPVAISRLYSPSVQRPKITEKAFLMVYTCIEFSTSIYVGTVVNR